MESWISAVEEKIENDNTPGKTTRLNRAKDKALPAVLLSALPGSDPGARESVAGPYGSPVYTSSSRIASPHGVMISVAPQFLPFLRITPAGTAKA